MTEHNAPNTHNAHNTRVVVIGGGYSGTLAANHLRTRGDLDITLVNPRPKFVERIRLHQHAAGNYEATVDYGTLLGEGIKLVVDTATRIDTATRRIELASGRAVNYDYVIYAVGSTGAIPASVPGAAEFAYPIAELEQAQRLRAILDDVRPGAPVTVVGGGLTGIESAAELAEQGHNVTLVCGGQLATPLSEPGRRSVAKTLRKLGVTILEADVVTEVRADAVVFADGAVRPTALTIWAAGFGVPELAAASGLYTDELGRLLTDETLTSIDDDRIVAAGDCASPSGVPLRMCCASAGQLGPQAANTVLSRIAGTAPASFQYGLPGTCTSLGRRAGILQLGHQDDTPVNFFIAGRVGAKVKEAICKGTIWGQRQEARKPGASFWFKGGPRPSQPAFAPKVVTET
ncbi:MULTISPECIES: FAD-dependent oxidoreductase [unclassified Mycobacterium]|uniref:NAD(P)/FAD-dependent oxidoreductase n=1 Tax=unclassified Mycobacterium TaxID=2642494 RepID=UPI0007401E6D|nr:MULTISPECIES: FAD-dependent oxidoreductase [unclassified Mycobacterium]KUH86189.1 pyridine nucleotide-disulfide oxidoreductase [Mycobacterium sp. IS-1556]KUH86889.1 pyridine nucleotide-disulfide oxidoreductase [Mycobacterium sp. GA-0227b]KUH92166.1 pyridine nucleotide-disulfide oxidoreductase [Mycobacterium sp. GA-1999]